MFVRDRSMAKPISRKRGGPRLDRRSAPFGGFMVVLVGDPFSSRFGTTTKERGKKSGRSFAQTNVTRRSLSPADAFAR